MYDRILLPTDGSSTMDRVVEHTMDIATRRDATVHVLYVVDDRAFLTLDDAHVDSVLEDLDERGREALTETASALEAEGIDCVTVTRRGNPADEIMAYATEADIDLVTMGTHGADYERNLLGSVSQKVVTMSPVPVLTVNVAAGESDGDATDDTEGREDERPVP